MDVEDFGSRENKLSEILSEINPRCNSDLGPVVMSLAVSPLSAQPFKNPVGTSMNRKKVPVGEDATQTIRTILEFTKVAASVQNSKRALCWLQEITYFNSPHDFAFNFFLVKYVLRKQVLVLSYVHCKSECSQRFST